MSDNQYGNAQFEQKPDGYIIVNGNEVAHTLQCGHCGVHFISVKGSGKQRGYCLLCMRVTCGKKACLNHAPQEKQLEKEEAEWKNTQMEREYQTEQQIKKAAEIERRFGSLSILGGK